MEAFPIAIHNKIRRQKVTIAMAAECRTGVFQKAEELPKKRRGLLLFRLQGCPTQISFISPIHPLSI